MRLAPVVAAVLALAACTQTTVLSTRHSLVRDTDAHGLHTTIQDERGVSRNAHTVETGTTLRMDCDTGSVPVISPDGRFAAVQTSCDAPWNVRMGDPLPPQGLRTRIEAVSLDATTLGLPTNTLEGAWLLGRAATNDAFLAERPRADGGRDIALVPWNGGPVREVVADEWTNAFASVAPNGTLAWCRRKPEGGEWQLVLERNGQRRVLPSAPGDQWFFPVFAGDGTGLFALRLSQTALMVAWLPFEKDGLPSMQAALDPLYSAPLALGASLTTAAQVAGSTLGLAASCPGSDRVVVYVPGLARMATWAPGGKLEVLAEGSVAATMLDDEAVLVTTREMLGKQRLLDQSQHLDLLAEGAWVARPTTTAPTVVVIMRAMNGRVELAHMDVLSQSAAR